VSENRHIFEAYSLTKQGDRERIPEPMRKRLRRLGLLDEVRESCHMTVTHFTVLSPVQKK
jgi:hypothetical protein